MSSSDPSTSAVIAGESEDMDKVLTSYFDKTVNSNTIKEKATASSELSKGDLLKILSYLEGEVQARDVVIATLKCERVKRLLADNKYSLTSDPFAALKRDSFATYVNSSDSKDDVELMRLWESQKLSFQNLIRKQRQAMRNLQKVLTDTQTLHSQVVIELEDKKLQEIGRNDVSSVDLENERQLRCRLDKELTESQQAHEEDKNRHKSIVLLLLAERKKIIRGFVEEGKRSADLLVMLEEEKRQALAMAEGLEEESQKALHMEAELERQASAFRVKHDRLTVLIRGEQDCRLETENQFKQLRLENDSLRKQLAEAHSVAMFQASLNNQTQSNTATKKNSPQANVVRPTATISSVPVSQPTTGIAKSVSPVQHHSVASTPHSASTPTPVNSNSLSAQVKTTSTPDKSPSSLITPKKYSLGRGVPPPVPPNKPSLPPKSGNLTAKIHAAKIEQQIT